MPFYLSVHTESEPERVFRLNERREPLVIGRADTADLRLNAESVSGRHALLQVEEGKVSVRDAASRSDILVNGRPVRPEMEPWELRRGDHLHLGGVRLSVLADPGIRAEEWQALADGRRLLHYLPLRGHQRKLRLLACACCRLVWDQLADPSSRRAVGVAERCADGECEPGELDTARSAALGALTRVDAAGWNAADAATRAAEPCALEAAALVLQRLPQVAPQLPDLARDLLGDFFQPGSVPREWLEANGGAVARIATAIYNEREFGSLPILADALEDAGCTDAALLEHCRGPAPHHRGCWALDTLLGWA
jgi:hypothetical protein